MGYPKQLQNNKISPTIPALKPRANVLNTTIIQNDPHFDTIFTDSMICIF